jgi:GT2 family glycosyltransferase
MESKPLVSIITVNYNSAEITAELLRSIRGLQYPTIEVIVVDNASREDPGPRLREVFPEVRLIRSPENLGFAGGNNLGIRSAGGEYLLLVNNDTELTPGLVGGLLDIFGRYHDAGMVSPKFHYYYHPDVIEYAGYNELNVLRGSCTMVGNREKDEGQYDMAGATHFAHGGGMMIPASVVREVGVMPECYFLYYEELDWSEQIKRKGYKIYYQPHALIYHKESMTVGKKSLIKTYYHCRNRILFMRRNVGPFALLAFTLYFIFFTIPKNSLSFLIRRETDHFKAFWKGIFWNMSHFNVKN